MTFSHPRSAVRTSTPSGRVARSCPQTTEQRDLRKPVCYAETRSGGGPRPHILSNPAFELLAAHDSSRRTRKADEQRVVHLSQAIYG